MKRIFLPVFLSLLLTSALAQQSRPPQASNGWRYHPSRVLVRFRGAPQFHPGSGQARLLSQRLNLFLVDNPQDVPVPEAKIGRASCRERVESKVVGGSERKKR